MRRGKGLKEENVFLTHNYESAELGCKPKYAPLQASALYFSEQIRLRPALSRAGGNRRNQGTAFFSLIPEAVVPSSPSAQSYYQ